MLDTTAWSWDAVWLLGRVVGVGVVGAGLAGVLVVAVVGVGVVGAGLAGVLVVAVVGVGVVGAGLAGVLVVAVVGVGVVGAGLAGVLVVAVVGVGVVGAGLAGVLVVAVVGGWDGIVAPGTAVGVAGFINVGVAVVGEAVVVVVGRAKVVIVVEVSSRAPRSADSGESPAGTSGPRAHPAVTIIVSASQPASALMLPQVCPLAGFTVQLLACRSAAAFGRWPVLGASHALRPRRTPDPRRKHRQISLLRGLHRNSSPTM